MKQIQELLDNNPKELVVLEKIQKEIDEKKKEKNDNENDPALD